MIAWIAAASCLLALLPAVLFLRNLALYAPPPLANGRVRARCSVLIPARNEESTIANAVRSVLRNQGADFEVIVLDDDSADQTAQIVRALANDDGRVHLATAPPLPAGWCGKQHACHVLAHLAQHPLLIFMDADVRLKSDALARMSAFMEQSGAALASGVPQQETRTFSERLLIPLIHFVLLGFLPINRMRASRDPVFGAGCGQLFVARREAYHSSGGHRAIRATLHDGPKLARVFRAAGFATDLFDATCIAECRMYSTNAEVWRGLARNATKV
jgi:glycosyltransferase involved in cell wall biosynthesis